MTGSSLTAKNGGMLYTTNTESTFYLKNVAITPSAKNDFFLKCTGNSNARGWGQSGANGADCKFTADTLEMTGDVIWDSISTLDFQMTNGSTLTGAFIQDNSNVDSTLTTLTCKGTIQGADGKSVSIVGTDGTVYEKGDSAYTITVTSYSK